MEGIGYLLSAAWQVLLISFLIAFLAAVVLAFFVLYPLKRQSEKLASALERIANGERDVSFPEQKVLEFETIAEASLVLQGTLSKEETLRDQWTADIAHDLRTPVTVLKGQLEAISDGVFTADAKRLDLLLRETGRLENLINSLSLLTRLESPNFKPEVQRISLTDLLRQTQARFEAEAAKRAMVVSIPTKQASVVADTALLTRSLDNLISNAIRYGEANSTITITFEADGQKNAVWLCIENEGHIDQAFLPHVFDRLSRSEHARSTEGSGLGLAIVKAIVEAHHWTIEAESNKTTRFILRFT
ncbi:Sensor kinase CusS [bioreactor metagenome]|uniref:histidine kinase n=1 Tax=bioreactor metagenome TaxID=1076179 RepID=A0A645DVJ5_9ZZZZ